MESFVVALAETFEFMQPFCSVAMHKQAAFESAPLKDSGSNHTLATETDMTDHQQQQHHHHARPADSSFARVHYLQERCDTSLTSSISEDEMLLPYDPSFHSNHHHHSSSALLLSPIPEQVTFFTPRAVTHNHAVSRLSLQWHVRRSAGGFKGIDEWTGRLCEEADARQDDDGFLGQVTCFRVSPTFVLPTALEEKQALRAVHTHLLDLAQYMTANTTLPTTTTTTVRTKDHHDENNKPLFGLPLVLITDVQVSQEYRGMGLGLLLVDETCRCLANPAQWVLLATKPDKLREYFGLLGFTPSGLLDGQVIIRWNDPYCMATHRYEDLCPHLPRVVIQ